MKKLIALCGVLLTLVVCSTGVFAAASTPEISVDIVSPSSIESKPVYNGDVQIVVKNLTDTEITNLECYLTVVDMTHKYSVPVDEVGLQAYQLREIASLPAHGETTVTIPIKVLYVGTFKFTASVMNDTKDYVITSAPLTAEMIALSKINKTFVTAVAIGTPIVLALGALFIVKHKKKQQ